MAVTRVALADGKRHYWNVVYENVVIEFGHDTAEGAERIRLRRDYRWLRDKWLAGPKGRLP